MFSTFKHVYTQAAATPEGTVQDTGQQLTGDTVIGGNWVVNANGGGANTITINFPATGFQCMELLATVPCVVTFTTMTVGGGSTVTLEAGVLRHIAASEISGACAGLSIGANTTSSGAAGVINACVLYNS